jgi:hypothetical protein
MGKATITPVKVDVKHINGVVALRERRVGNGFLTNCHCVRLDDSFAPRVLYDVSATVVNVVGYLLGCPEVPTNIMQ